MGFKKRAVGLGSISIVVKENILLVLRNIKINYGKAFFLKYAVEYKFQKGATTNCYLLSCSNSLHFYNSRAIETITSSIKLCLESPVHQELENNTGKSIVHL